MPSFQLETHIDGPASRGAVAVLMSAMALYLWTADEGWLLSALVTICSYIAATRGGLDLAGTLIHAIGIQAGWLLLWLAMPHPLAFAAANMSIAAICLRLVGTGERGRAVGLFLAVPSIYLCFQFPSLQGSGTQAATLLRVLTQNSIGSLPVLAFQWLRSDRNIGASAFRLVQGGFDPNFRLPSLIVPLGVGVVAWLARWCDVPHAQWLVWSALVVAYGDRAATSSKYRDRVIGVCLGAPFGGLLAWLLPPSPMLAAAALFLALLTLVSIRRYVIAYGVRSALIVCFIALSAGDRWSAVARMGDVVIGGFVGWMFYLAAGRLALWRSQRSIDRTAI